MMRERGKSQVVFKAMARGNPSPHRLRDWLWTALALHRYPLTSRSPGCAHSPLEDELHSQLHIPRPPGTDHWIGIRYIGRGAGATELSGVRGIYPPIIKVGAIGVREVWMVEDVKELSPQLE